MLLPLTPSIKSILMNKSMFRGFQCITKYSLFVRLNFIISQSKCEMSSPLNNAFKLASFNRLF